MTYIYDMAGGTEYQGEGLTCSHPLEAPKHEEASYQTEHRIELRLAEIEFTPSPAKSITPASLDLSALIRAIED